MQTFRLKVDDDGRVTIPDVHPGQIVTVQIPEVPEYLTLATARTDEERAAVIAEIRRLAREIRTEMGNPSEQLSLTHGDILYDENGLPK